MEILIALATSTGLMLPVIIIAILASIAAAKRGEASSGHPAHPGAETSAEGARARAGFSLGPARDPFVLEILILGAVLFGLTMALLLNISFLGQM
jgi:hypothetical protein